MEQPAPVPQPLTHDAAVDWAKIAAFSRQMIITLDGLWFMNILERLGEAQTMEVDIRVFISQFRIATRAWRKIAGLDGKSAADKMAVFQAMAHLYGHKFELFVKDGKVVMRIKQCAFFENLKRTGRAGSHDCRVLCKRLAPPWYEEIEPRTGGAGSVDLQLPVGGDHCDWSVDQPD